jgi:hypothetical protein
LPDDQFQLDAERHAEFLTLVTVLLRQFLAFELRFGRQPWPAVALVLGELGPATFFRQFRLFRQCGVICAGRVPVRRTVSRRRFQFWWFRAAAAATATRLAHASVSRRIAGQQAVLVRITDW